MMYIGNYQFWDKITFSRNRVIRSQVCQLTIHQVNQILSNPIKEGIYIQLMSSMAWVKICYSESRRISINYLFLKRYTHNLMKMQILQI